MKFINQYELEYADLKAAYLCTASKDVRFYLMGVLVGRGMIAATNGHLALICDEPNAKDIEEIIIPRDALSSFIKKVGRSTKGKKVFLNQIDEKYWLLEFNGNMEILVPVPGKFPNVKHIDINKPEKYTGGGLPMFDAKYLAIFQKIADIYNIPQAGVYPVTDKNAAYVEINNRVHGLLMPMRI